VAHVVSARKEETEALREALSSGAWHRHRGGAAALTAVDRCNRATRRLGGNAACQWFTGEAVGEGIRRKLTEAWMGHLGAGVWPEFHRRAARRGADADGQR
jgi:hypothetical protein